jgi:hypothetical protein
MRRYENIVFQTSWGEQGVHTVRLLNRPRLGLVAQGHDSFENALAFMRLVRKAKGW